MKTTSGRRPARSGAIAVCAATLAACGMTSHSYSVSAVPGGESAACTTVVNNSPHELGGRERTESDVKGTAVWGDGDVILRCGRISNVPESAPCSSVNGVDWVVNAANTHYGTKTMLTYGRTPAAEITLSERIKNKDVVIGEMSGIMAGLPEQKTCARRG